MASIFTGMYVDSHKIYFVAHGESGEAMRTTDILREEHTTPAEWLRALGYQTFGVQSNANVIPELGFAQGFDKDDYPFVNGANGEWVTDTALGGAWAMDEPFFLYAHYMDAHAPYGGPAGNSVPWAPIENVPPEEKALVDGKDFMAFLLEEAYEAAGVTVEDRFPELSEVGKDYVRERYDASCHYLDRHVARLIERLRRDFPHTIFAIASDHGEEFWERGGLGHGLTLNVEQLRVPFLIFGPGIAPRLIEAPATLIDIFPTVAGAAGLPPLETWQGLDLSTTEPDAARPRFSRTRSSKPTHNVDLVAGILEDDKLIHDFNRQREELFDLGADPEERVNLVEKEAIRASALRAIIEEHLTKANALAGPMNAAPTAALSDDHFEALEALGYLGDATEPEPNTAPLAP
jgi:arylsulfatase A-like enzyme